jgi:hypothetical protein
VIAQWATGWMIGDLTSSRNWEFFSSPHPERLWGPPIQWVPGAIFLGVKWPGREDDHSPPSSAEVKNAWSYTSTPQYAFMAWCLVKAEGQLYLLLLIVWGMFMNLDIRHLYYENVIMCTFQVLLKRRNKLHITVLS